LDVWDGGSRRYERFPDGNEVCWEVLSRELNETGFTEVLSQLPQWETVGDIAWTEKVAILKLSDSILEIPGWKVTTDVLQGQPVPNTQKGKGNRNRARPSSDTMRGQPSRGRQGALRSPQPPGTQGYRQIPSTI